LNWISSNDKSDNKVNAVTALYDNLNVRLIAEEKMQQLYNDALLHLDAIPIPEASKQPLKDLADSLMNRKN
jgi:geranylgeranyl diphosphate synthase type II